jgi:hypothetical protein
VFLIIVPLLLLLCSAAIICAARHPVFRRPTLGEDLWHPFDKEGAEDLVDGA